MSKLIGAAALTAEIRTEMQGHIDDVVAHAEQAVAEAAKSATNALRRKKTFTARRTTGAYAAGWSYKTEKTDLTATAIVHNRTKYMLTHLLEKGHGGPKPAGAYPHVAPVYESAAASLLARMR